MMALVCHDTPNEFAAFDDFYYRVYFILCQLPRPLLHERHGRGRRSTFGPYYLAHATIAPMSFRLL